MTDEELYDLVIECYLKCYNNYLEELLRICEEEIKNKK